MKRDKFSLSNYKLLSCNMGNLVPIGWFEALPGDTVQQATSLVCRVAPLVAPVMHPVHVRIHHFFVPFRLLWDEWEDFITGGPDGMDASEWPFLSFDAPDDPVEESSLADYLGIPPFTVSGNVNVSALPFRAYAMIWNEYFRDQDLQTELPIRLGGGSDPTDLALNSLQNVCWEKDYYTTARPWPAKGPAVVIPVGSSAPVNTTGANIQFRSSTDASTDRVGLAASGTNAVSLGGAGLGSTGNLRFGTTTGLVADLASATGASIQSLREAFAIERYEEARARYGSRFTEYLAYLGVRSSDARLQRPEYLGGGRQTIQWSEVLQTAPTTDGDDSEGVGNMKGHGIAALRSNRYRRFFEEHGIVMSLMSVLPKTIYGNGTKRAWYRETKEDYWQRELQHVGQQEVYNREVKALHTTPGGVFGYQDRYDEYRREESSVAGEFRDTLDYWHMARIFASDPTLNASFVQANPTDRIYASTASDQLYVMARHSIQARRLVSASSSSFVR